MSASEHEFYRGQSKPNLDCYIEAFRGEEHRLILPETVSDDFSWSQASETMVSATVTCPEYLILALEDMALKHNGRLSQMAWLGCVLLSELDRKSDLLEPGGQDWLVVNSWSPSRVAHVSSVRWSAESSWRRSGRSDYLDPGKVVLGKIRVMHGMLLHNRMHGIAARYGKMLTEVYNEGFLRLLEVAESGHLLHSYGGDQLVIEREAARWGVVSRPDRRVVNLAGQWTRRPKLRSAS